MKSLIALAGGGAVVTIWKSLHPVVKVPLLIGLGALATLELTKDANESWFSRQIFGGQAAQGDAQIVDPAATRKAMQAGQPVTGAAANFAAQYQGLDADAKQKSAYADAANESEDEILAKKAAGLRITSTEELRLIEIELKRTELRKETATTKMTEAMSGYASGVYSDSRDLQNNPPQVSGSDTGEWLTGVVRQWHVGRQK